MFISIIILFITNANYFYMECDSILHLHCALLRIVAQWVAKRYRFHVFVVVYRKFRDELSEHVAIQILRQK